MLEVGEAEPLDEIDKYIESCIIFGKQLTNYGLDLYSMEVYRFDEEGNEIRIIKEDYSKEK